MNENPAEMDTGAVVPEWTLGDRLAKALRHADISVQEMADHLDVHRNTVSGYINDRARPSKSTVWDWAVRCGLPPTWVATGVVDLREGADDQGIAQNTWSVHFDDDDNVLLFPGRPAVASLLPTG